MPDPLITGSSIAAIGYVAQKLFGKTLEEMGEDLNSVYKANRDKITTKAAQSVIDPNDGKIPNLRVARDIIWNGAVTSDEVCAEYFGGILAASRSDDGKDDSTLIYVDCIKALSAKQIHLHYIVYQSLEGVLLKDSHKINPGSAAELQARKVYFASLDLTRDLNIPLSIDLNVLHRQGLVSAYTNDNHEIKGKNLPYAEVYPTVFGVLLYAAALNHLENWREFGTKEFPKKPDIKLASIYAPTLEEISKLAGMPDPG